MSDVFDSVEADVSARALVHRHDGKVRPTISGPLAYYIRELHTTGLYGSTPSEVVRTLVREGIERAVVNRMIKLKMFSKDE